MPQPDMMGPAARAWRLPDGWDRAGVGAWIVHAPGSHPLWPWRFVFAIHLRGAAGLPEPFLHFPGASHEIVVISLDPKHYPPELDGGAGSLHPLTPPDVVEQVMGLTDDQATELLDLLVVGCCGGHLVPDADWRGAWRQTLELTSEHMRVGEHPA